MSSFDLPAEMPLVPYLELDGVKAGRDPSSRNAWYICSSATPLSNGVTGMSPQSLTVAHDLYGLIPARVLKAVPGIWRALAARMARGPKRAPGWIG